MSPLSLRRLVVGGLLPTCVTVSCSGTNGGGHPAPAATAVAGERARHERAQRDSVRRDSVDQAAIRRDNDEEVAALLAGIGDRATRPAGEVFENLQIPWLKDVPARTFLSIMSGGYARALGVRCSHCHTTDDFARDDKRPKRAAREMAAMHRMINQELARMQHLQTPATQNRAINCAMCHRGQVDPRGTR